MFLTVHSTTYIYIYYILQSDSVRITKTEIKSPGGDYGSLSGKHSMAGSDDVTDDGHRLERTVGLIGSLSMILGTIIGNQ